MKNGKLGKKVGGREMNLSAREKLEDAIELSEHKIATSHGEWPTWVDELYYAATQFIEEGEGHLLTCPKAAECTCGK